MSSSEMRKLMESINSITETPSSDPVLKALSDAYTFITQPQSIQSRKNGPAIITYHTNNYNKLTQQLRDAMAIQKGNNPINEQTGGLDPFCTAYIEAALWSSTDNSDERGGEPLDKNYDIEDFDDESLRKMEQDCKAFQEKAGDLIDGQEEQAGHDFWLTRNGHGAGFWDGDWPEPAATELTNLSKEFGEVDLYIGDDGKVYSL